MAPGDERQLVVAARRQRWDDVRLLVENGVDVDAVDENGRSALMLAARAGHEDTVRFLVDRGASVDLVSNSGETAVSFATKRGHQHIQRVLVQHVPNSSAVLNEKPRSSSRSELPKWFISPFEVSITKFVESGNIGGDFLATWLDAEVALKLFVPGTSSSEFAEEVRVWHQLRHPNVIKLYGACDVGHNFYVCECASYGPVVEHLAKSMPPARTPWKYIYHAALGLAYLHERGIVHGNLCTNNILIGSDELGKLADFGSTVTNQNAEFESSHNLSSVRWRSPEQLRGENSSNASDIYALGLCAIEAVTLKRPWADTRNDYSVSWFKSNWFPESSSDRQCAPNSLSGDLVEVVEKLCCHDPTRRQSAIACVYLFERLAVEEETRILNSSGSPSTVMSLSEYADGDISAQWEAIRIEVSISAASDLNGLLLHDLEAIYKTIQASPQSVKLLEQVYRLFIDATHVIKHVSQRNQVLHFSGSQTVDNVLALCSRINAIKRLLGIGIADRRHRKPKAIDLRRKQIQAIISTGIKDNESSDTDVDIIDTPPVWFVPWHELFVSEWHILGKGGFGSVHLAKWLDSEVVVKLLDFGGIPSAITSYNPTLESSFDPDSFNFLSKLCTTQGQQQESVQRQFKREADIWFNFSHPHVVRLFGACHIGRPFFVCEYASHGSLDKYLEKHPNEIWHKLYEAALGLLYLHERGVVHCDLKCNNIVVGRDRKAKVTDFGLSSAANVADVSVVGGHVSGAWNWLAPELLLGKSTTPTRESDVYSFAMCIIEALRVVEGASIVSSDADLQRPRVPWQYADRSTVMVLMKRGELPGRPVNCTDEQWDLIMRMTRFDPEERIRICTVVDELASRSSGNWPAEDASSGRVSQLLLSGNALVGTGAQTSVSRHLRGVYELLWRRFDDIRHRLPNQGPAMNCLERLVLDATNQTAKIMESRTTLVQSTDAALRGYGLHRQLDKFMVAEFLKLDMQDKPSLHEWEKSCCKLLGISDSVAEQLCRQRHQ